MSRSVKCLSVSLLLGATSLAGAQDADVATVLITAQRDSRTSSGATGLDLAIKDTPQSISVVTSQAMDVFGTENLNDALRLATGINVEEWETNRTNYAARGFEIKNTQIDGVGLPNDWGIVTGAMDSFGYEKLEVIRGANGLLTGVGNGSGTINFVRKRPTNDTRGSVEVSGGSWNYKRIEADYSTPLTDSGSWAVRLVGAGEDKDSYLRSLTNSRLFLYGVVDGQIGENATVAFGYSYQRADTDGNMWGALTLSNSDGTQAEFDVSASPTQDWTFWNTSEQAAFAELTYALPRDWKLKLSYNYRDHWEDDQLFFTYAPTGLDPVTHEGLYGYPGKFIGNTHANLGDAALSGRFTAFGREHEAMLGLSLSSSQNALDTYAVPFDAPAWGALPGFPYAGNVVPEPVWGARSLSGSINQRLERAYGATRLSLTSRLKAVLGFNYAEYHRDGENSGGHFDQTEDNVSPYAGLTFDLTEQLLAYASYSDIYQPQDQYDANHVYLAPSKGVNWEAGFKGEWLDRRLLTTLALFRAEQEGLATFAGIDGNGSYYYKGVDVTSKGFELEAAGRLNDYVQLTAGYTHLQLEDAQGASIYEWVPRSTFNLSLQSKVPGYARLAFGLNGRWQSDISAQDGYSGFTVRQDSYATLNLFGRWEATPGLTLRANVNNVTDEKYIGSLYSIGYYGPPRNYSVSLAYRF